MVITRPGAWFGLVLCALFLLASPALAQVDLTDLPGTIEAQYYASPGGEGIDNIVDNNPQTKYLTFHSAGWVQFNPSVPNPVSRYAITSANDAPERDPSSWTLEGSDDGANWTVLDSRSGEVFPARFLRREFSCTGTAAYASYRLKMTCVSGTILQLSEWELLAAPLDHDVSPVSVIAPVSSPVAPLHPLVAVRNNGRNAESFSVTCRVDSEGVQVYTQTMAVSALAAGAAQTLEFPLWMPGANLAYTLTASTSLATDQLPANDLAATVTNYRKRVYIVPYAHLDLQWSWTLQTTINTLLPNTLHRNFALLDKYPDYCFSFEGAYRYSLMKQYYPQDYETLKGYIARGRWHPAGAMVEAADVNIPSAEALIRQILYGNRFFQQEFGKTSADLILPDCFGFPYTLPTIASHCGIRGFSGSKFDSWGGFRPAPFSIGQWEGVDGSRIVACLKPGSIWSTWEVRNTAVEMLGSRTGIYTDLDYLSVGDQGGAPPDTAVASLEARMQQNDTSAVEVLTTSSDQLFLDLTSGQAAKLPVYKGELLLSTHGTGTYTVREDQKILNRANELSAVAAEQASVVAELSGGPPYPTEEIQRQWFAFLAHDFHDDLPGVCAAAAYTDFSTPVRRQALASFTTIRDRAARSVAASLDTYVEDQDAFPVVVGNPSAFDRHDIVDAPLVFPGGNPPSVRVYDATGREVPSQITGTPGDTLHLLFAADVPAAGYAVYQAWASHEPCALPTALQISLDRLENARYRVLIDENGDPSSIFDKQARRELLAAPCRFALLNDAGGEWPAWEIQYADVSAPPRAFAGAPVTKTIVDSGAAQVTLRVTRTLEGSSFIHDYSLTADTNGFLKITSTIDWTAA
ncbi:MAG TPA: glycoside hydrolase family 38 C-terminal domain-containing protein, partial [Bacteroidota bacterium]